MKTTQKIYFPKAFNMPGSKHQKKDSKAASISQEHQFSPTKESSNIKRAVVNLESEDQSLEAIPKSVTPTPLQQFESLHKDTEQHTFFEQKSMENVDMQGGHNEKSFNTIEQMVETQTEKSNNNSKMSGGNTRRSRKDRSHIRGKTGRNAITPHVICTLQGQNSLNNV